MSFSDKWEGVGTKIKLKCTIDGNIWDTTTISSFLGGRGCPKCKFVKSSKNNTKPYKVMVDSFMLCGKFKEGTSFKRNTIKMDGRGQFSYWDYTCPACSVDEYVNAGMCNGVFTASAGSLRSGKLSCRCTPPHHWTQQQREYQIKMIVHEEGLTFLGWDSTGYKNTFSKFKWLCNKGHECETQVSPFLGGNRCITCSGGINGFYPHRSEEDDYLYLLNFNYEYWKIGRSFDVNSRLKSLSSSSKMPIDKILVVRLYSGRHIDVYDIEQNIIEHLIVKGLVVGKGSGGKGDFSRETLIPEGASCVLKLLESIKLTELDCYTTIEEF